MDIDAEPDDALEHERLFGAVQCAARPARPARRPLSRSSAVLARSSSSQEEVFDSVLDNARRLCGADVAQIHLLTEGFLRLDRASRV